MKKLFLKSLPFCIFFIFSFANAQAPWPQLGNDINGVAAEDEFGICVSLNAWGNIVAVGAPYNDEAGGDAGHVRVFEWVNSLWVQKGSTLNGTAGVNFFGNSVSISGNGTRVAVGAPFNNENGLSSGQVRVFEFNGNDWVQIGNVINGKSEGDQAGYSLSLSSDGNTVAIGSPYSKLEEMDAGLVSVYQYSENSWTQKGNDLIADAEGDLFGFSLDINDNGNVLVVGAPNKELNGSDAGQVKVFTYNQNNWEMKGSAINGQAGDFFGYTLGLSGNGERLVSGSPGNDDNGLNAGHIRMFQFEVGEWSDSWGTIEGEAEGDRFGSSVSMSNDGSTLAAGAIFNLNENSGKITGQIRVFELLENNWQQRLESIYGKSATDQFGYSVSLSQDGWQVCGGARLSDVGGNNSGQVSVFGNSTTGIQANSNESSILNVYPNPNNGVFTLASKSDGMFTFINSLGQTVHKVSLTANVLQSINISDLATGVYYITGKSNNIFYHQKMVLMK